MSRRLSVQHPVMESTSDEDGSVAMVSSPLTDHRKASIKKEPGIDPGSLDVLEDVRSPTGSEKSDKGDKICGICGDKALGCNFDAISCESCKAFFRRNALKDKKTKCLFSGNCKIDLHTRRFCPHCRLQKCFSVGMKKDFILGDAERKRRAAKVMTNRTKRMKKSEDDTQPSTPGAPPSPADSLSDTPQTPQTPLTPQQPSTPNPTDLPSPNDSGDTSNMLCLLRNARAIFSADAMMKPPADFTTRTMNQEEESMLQELLQIYDLSFTADLEPLIHIKQIDPSLNQLVNQSSITVLRLIKFAKRLEDFARLPQDCQIGILKGTWIHILLLRSVSLYDIERDMWTTPRGEIPTEILRNATGFDDLHDHHVSYSKSIKTMVPDDLTIVILMIVIVLFSPESPHVTLRETVSNIQDKYLVLLKHYLETKYTYHRAANLFPRLMMKLKELNDLAEIHGKYLLDVNPGEIEPIMLEILDLK